MHNNILLSYSLLSLTKVDKLKSMKTIFYLFIAILLASCSIQKRHYSNGWNINFHSRFSSIETNSLEQNNSVIDSKLSTSKENSPLKDSILESEMVEDQKTKPETRTGFINNRPIDTTPKKQIPTQLVGKKIHLSPINKTYTKVSNKVKKIVHRKIKPRNKNATQMVGAIGAILIVIGIIIAIFAIAISIFFLKLLDELLSIF